MTVLGGGGPPCSGVVPPTRKSSEGYRSGPLHFGQPAPAKHSVQLVTSLSSAIKWLSPAPQKVPGPALSSSKQSSATFPQWGAEALTLLVGQWEKGEGQCGTPNLEACQLPLESGGCGASQQEVKAACALLHPRAFSCPSLHSLCLCSRESGDHWGPWL